MARTQGHRLTNEQREQIRNAPSSETLADLAKRFNTSVNTVQRYRSGKKAPPTKEAATKIAPKSGFREMLRTVAMLPLSDSELRTVIGSIIKS
jgi:transcriptional regulator with XRE-family HTH domain